MERAEAKIVPILLNFEQNQRRINIAEAILTTFNGDPDFLEKVITGDESWVYDYDIDSPIITMVASRRNKSEKARRVQSNVKVLLTVFFDCNGVVQYEFLPQGHTVKKEYYFEVMRRDAICQKRT